MAVTYKNLWNVLDNRHMSMADLRKISCIAPNTMTRLRRNEPVMFTVLDKICATLDYNYGEIMDCVLDRRVVDI